MSNLTKCMYYFAMYVDFSFTTQFHLYHEKFLRTIQIVNRMVLGGMEKQTEYTKNLATGLQHVVTRTTAESALLDSFVAVSF